MGTEGAAGVLGAMESTVGEDGVLGLGWVGVEGVLGESEADGLGVMVVGLAEEVN